MSASGLWVKAGAGSQRHQQNKQEQKNCSPANFSMSSRYFSSLHGGGRTACRHLVALAAVGAQQAAVGAQKHSLRLLAAEHGLLACLPWQPRVTSKGDNRHQARGPALLRRTRGCG